MHSAIVRHIFIAELVLLALPLSLLFLIFGPFLFLWSTIASPDGESIVFTSLVVLASLSLFAGWVLSFRYLRGGLPALTHAALWWRLSAPGALLVVIGLTSNIAPQSVPYSSWWLFRQDLSYFSYGVLLLIPFTHLVFVRFTNMGANYSLKRTAAGRLR